MNEKTKKATRTVVGGLVLLVGIIAIPYPGPGWLIVFAGLAILAKDYPWAARVLAYGRERYDAWGRWIKRQNWFVQSITAILTVLVVVVTIWLLNGYGLLNAWFNLGMDWLQSPFIK
ncbi:MAG TPA: TIGR02611 family protein [Candidatus Saccharibacteria bacterium]|nr:TIGR02611 family protein [Candidatus Saccharibacteria bacterium]HRK94563.1 TIGR02611 family protein [Candidatus Saccharibacteria bacterium]